MAKRYYNLEKETKEGLKFADKIGVPFGDASNNTITIVNNYIKIGKSLGLIYNSEDIYLASSLPHFVANFSNSFCYKNISNNGIINLINPFLNGYVSLFQGNYGIKTDEFGGGIKLQNSVTGVIPFNHSGTNTSFTILFWAMKYNKSGVNTNGFLQRETYQLNGFRAGFWNRYNAYNFWSGQSGGNIYCQTSTNTVIDNVPIQIALTYDDNNSIARIYINGALSKSASGLIKPRISANLGLIWNGSQDASTVTSHSYQILTYHRTLSSAEIFNHYTATKGRFGL